MILILNYKTYLESSGDNSIALTEAAYNFSISSKHTIIVCPQLIDTEMLLKQFPQTTNFKIWAQHVDYQTGDKETGYITVNTLERIGIEGSIVNHAEHKVNEISNYSVIDPNFKLCFCISNILELSLAIGKNPNFKPAYIAYEPPELIGGDISVSEASPDNIENIVDQFTGYNILVGAGIKSRNDVQTALKLGAKGVLIASGYVFSKNKELFLNNLTNF